MKISAKKLRFYVLLFAAIVLVLVAVFGPILAPHDPNSIDLHNILQPPGPGNLLGTDRIGRDIFSRLLHAMRNSFAMTFIMVLIITLIGSLIGMIAGYFGGLVDKIAMQLADMLLAFPAMVFAVLAAAILGTGINNTLAALALVSWARYARLTRGLVLEIRHQEYVTLARFSGSRWHRILLKYIMPNILPYIVVTTTSDIGEMMITLSALSFLGLVTPVAMPELGSMLANYRIYIMTIPHMALFPACAVLVTVVVFSLLGDSLLDVLDPKSRI